MPRIVVLGSINVDLTVPVRKLPAPGETALGDDLRKGQGGKGANQAVAAARAGGAVLFVAAVGEDDHGREALEHLRREQVDVSHAVVVPGAATGAALILVDDGGENLIGVASGANRRLTPEHIDRLPDSIFQPGAILLAGLESPLATVAHALRRAKSAGMTTILNPAPADRALLRDDLLLAVDLLTPNRREAEALTGLALDQPDESLDAARKLVEAGAGAVVITLGAAGYIAASGSGTLRGRAFPVEAVDTVGAGDAFNGCLAASIARGLPLKDALKRASAAAALAVMRPGAQGSLPTAPEIDRLVGD